MLWAGVPVVTSAGRTMAARVAASVVMAAGVGELVGRGGRDMGDVAIGLVRAAVERYRVGWWGVVDGG